MKRSKLKLTRLLIAAFMLFSAVALSMPGTQPANAATIVTDFCADCAQQCWNDANTGENNAAYWNCVDQLGDTSAHRDACYNTVVIGYYNSCVTFFCNSAGCKIVRKMPTSRPGDN